MIANTIIEKEGHECEENEEGYIARFGGRKERNKCKCKKRISKKTNKKNSKTKIAETKQNIICTKF